jgi:hypothetical protein
MSMSSNITVDQGDTILVRFAPAKDSPEVFLVCDYYDAFHKKTYNSVMYFTDAVALCGFIYNLQEKAREVGWLDAPVKAEEEEVKA